VDHYKIGGIETLDFLRAKLTKEQYKGYLIGNVVKYLSRHEHKSDAIGDIEKAIDYLSMYYMELKEKCDEKTST
jgi:hypothetical protein